eukprot:c14620_g1_i1.p1 GENE.c14620_g1_i1~~c14620_g1_i1.p1  ORF type:complete len:213 (-),score=57.90 c14620_g1_i1:28-666(-)
MSLFCRFFRAQQPTSLFQTLSTPTLTSSYLVGSNSFLPFYNSSFRSLSTLTPTNSEKVRQSTISDKTWEAPNSTKGFKKSKSKVKLPLLSEVIRNFVRLVHPDRFANYPELHDVNQRSLMALNEFIQHIKTKVDDDHRYPAAAHQELTFYVTTEQGIRKLPVVLKTTGGNCQHVIKSTFQSMFARCGLPDDFEWDEAFWKENNTHLYEETTI